MVCYCSTTKEENASLIRCSINQAAIDLENITTRTFDCHVLVLLLSPVERLKQAGEESIFVVLLKKSNTEGFNLIKIFDTFGADICQELLLFHAFSGCDASSNFYGRGKFTFWDAWMSFSKSTELAYTSYDPYFGKDHRNTDISKARCTLFSKFPDPKLKDIFLSKDALLEQIKRLSISRECLDNVFLPSSELWVCKSFFELCIKHSLSW